MKALQAFLAFFLILGFILKPTQAQSFCDKLANGNLAIKAMGPAGDKFLIVTETKKFLKLPLSDFKPTELAFPNKTEPSSLTDPTFNFPDASLWLTGSESSFILMEKEKNGTTRFYEIPFEGANYKNLTLEGNLSEQQAVAFLPNYKDNSAHILVDRRSESVVTANQTVLFNQTSHHIEINQTNDEFEMLPVAETPTTAFIHEGTIYLVTRQFVLRFEFDGKEQLAMQRMKRSDFIKCTPPDFSWLGIILGIVVLVTLAFAIGIWWTRKPDTSSVTH